MMLLSRGWHPAECASLNPTSSLIFTSVHIYAISTAQQLPRTLPPAILEYSRIMRLLQYNNDSDFRLTEFFKGDKPKKYARHPATPIINGHRHTLPRSANPSGPSGTALCDKTVLGSPGEKRGRRDTHREIGSKSLRSDDSDDAYDKGDADLPPAKRRKLYEAPALIASPRLRRPPSSSSLEMDDTQSQADDGCSPTSVDNEQHDASHTSRNSSMAIKERFPKEDKEFDELAMDDHSQQGNDTDGSDNSADEDYAHDVGDEDEENTRPTKQRKSPLHSRDKALRHRQSPASTLNKQLHTPRPSQSPSATQESQSSAEYREWSCHQGV